MINRVRAVGALALTLATRWASPAPEIFVRMKSDPLFLFENGLSDLYRSTPTR